MKINKLRFIGGQTVDFPMVGADPSGPFILKAVDGLGPPKVTVNVKQTILEGGVYQGRKADNRQVVGRIGLQPDWDVGQTPEELRVVLYSLLTPMPDQDIVMQAMSNNTVVAQVTGQISSIEPSIFTKDPEVQLTLDTFSPYLIAPSPIIESPAKTNNGGNGYFNIDNVGDAPAGFKLTLAFTAAVTSNVQISLGDAPYIKAMTLAGVDWVAGDKLVIDTRDKQKGVWRINSGSSTLHTILNSLTDQSPWLLLYGGTNHFFVNTTAFDIPPNGFEHTPRYWGV